MRLDHPTPWPPEPACGAYPYSGVHLEQLPVSGRPSPVIDVVNAANEGRGIGRRRPAGSELYYGTSDGRLMAVAYTADGDSFHAEQPRLVGRFTPELFGANFDVHPDGKRFAIRPAPEDPFVSPRDELVFVFNFFEELERLLPTK